MTVPSIKITIDREWLALVAYRMVLERIVADADERPWEQSEAADMARRVLAAFPEAA